MTTCDMRKTCTRSVTHIGEKGYVYCSVHASDRQGVEHCRKMRAWEIKLVQSGIPLPSYKPIRKPSEKMSKTEIAQFLYRARLYLCNNHADTYRMHTGDNDAAVLLFWAEYAVQQ